jgi:flagellar hook-length control protein FliK
MQVDMKSDSWGTVSVHATLSNGQVGAEIQVNDRDAHAALTAGLQSLEKSLSEKGIQIVNLDVSQGLGYGHAQSQGQQEKQAGQPSYAAKGYAQRSAVKTETPTVSAFATTKDDFVLSRVSVRA